MGGGFSKAKPAAPPKPVISDIDRTVLDLKNARDRLQRYRLKLEQDEAKLLEQARRARDSGKKERALGLLRLRKYKQAQASSCEDQLLNVHQMVETIGSKQNDNAVLAAMASGKDTLKRMHEETTVDDVLDLMDEIREGAEVEQEISEILSGVPSLSPADEEAVEAELAAMAAEMNGVVEGVVEDNKIELPDVPTEKLPEPVAKHSAKEEAATTKPERVAVLG
jgi:charged multivesicular body protein 6